MGITIRDVAKKLNLSITTISRALDGYSDVAEDTRQLVIETAQEMGYTPNQAARQLRRHKADAIGYILPSRTPRFGEPFFSEFIAGLGDETALHPAFDLLISIAPPGEQGERQLYQDWVSSRKVDGFILNRLHLDDWRVQYLAQHGVPFSALEASMDRVDFPRVEVDRKAGMNELISHLARQGFRRIAFMGGQQDLTIYVDQHKGYREGLEAENLTYHENLVYECDLTTSAGYQAAKNLLELASPPDAITCINDETAMGALHAAHETGLKVGKDLAVTGFDGVVVTKYSEPPLTTLDIPIYEIARQLVRMLLDEINQRPGREHKLVIVPRLIIRESSNGKA